jgi:hypothetical protein
MVHEGLVETIGEVGSSLFSRFYGSSLIPSLYVLNGNTYSTLLVITGISWINLKEESLGVIIYPKKAEAGL